MSRPCGHNRTSRARERLRARGPARARPDKWGPAGGGERAWAGVWGRPVGADAGPIREREGAGKLACDGGTWPWLGPQESARIVGRRGTSRCSDGTGGAGQDEEDEVGEG